MIAVLRMGHRQNRDKRVTTHCGLVARSFGASMFFLTGDNDASIIRSLNRVQLMWGGDMKIIFQNDWKSLIARWKAAGGVVVHLTMYGLPLYTVFENIVKLDRNILVIVGAEKVPGLVYKLADFNIAIGNQPHSEVAALAIFLDRLLGGKEFDAKFSNARISIIPQARGKKLAKNLM